MRTGVILINLGTPKSTRLFDVGRYLYQFLSDPRVIDLPWILRKILVCALIVPFRTRKSARAYRKIWLTAGAPLLVNSQALSARVQLSLGEDYSVALAMRYGQPAIKSVLAELLAQKLHQLIIIPLFPQYSSAATGSALAQVLQEISQYTVIPQVKVIDHWYQEPAYIAAVIRSIEQHSALDHHLVFSFHGLPVRQNMVNCTNPCNEQLCTCYRAQCSQTAHRIANEMQLAPDAWSLAFQSRLGRIEWLQPYLDQHLIALYAQGVRKICIISPGFIADCLETSEELGIQLKELWLALGGTEFTVIPCLNAAGAEIFTSIIHKIT